MEHLERQIEQHPRIRRVALTQDEAGEMVSFGAKITPRTEWPGVVVIHGMLPADVLGEGVAAIQEHLLDLAEQRMEEAWGEAERTEGSAEDEPQ